MNKAVVYTDGSCSGNPGPGGWAALIISPDDSQFFYCGAETETTNNRMELLAAVYGLVELKNKGLCRAILKTDSEYLRRGMTEWIISWQKNGWKTSDGGNVKNKDLWEKLIMTSSVFTELEWQWVRGHASESGNEFVNKLAQQMTKEIKLRSLKKIGNLP